MTVSIVTLNITINHTDMITTAFSFNTCNAKISTSASITITPNTIVTLAILIMMLYSYTATYI